MTFVAHPEHIDLDERREGVIAFIDRVTQDGRQTVIEDVAFDDDRIHPSLTLSSAVGWRRVRPRRAGSRRPARERHPWRGCAGPSRSVAHEV